MSVSIRVAKATDVHELVLLAARTFPLACPPEMDRSAISDFVHNELSAEVFGQWIAENDTYVLVATDGAMLVGYSVCINGEVPTNAQLEQDLPAESTVVLSKFYVDPDFHGAGVSHKMMSHVLEHFLTTSHQWMWLGTNAANARAIGFYERVGFKHIGTRQFEVGGVTAEDVVLARQLPTLDNI